MRRTWDLEKESEGLRKAAVEWDEDLLEQRVEEAKEDLTRAVEAGCDRFVGALQLEDRLWSALEASREGDPSEQRVDVLVVVPVRLRVTDAARCVAANAAERRAVDPDLVEEIVGLCLGVLGEDIVAEELEEQQCQHSAGKDGVAWRAVRGGPPSNAQRRAAAERANMDTAVAKPVDEQRAPAEEAHVDVEQSQCRRGRRAGHCRRGRRAATPWMQTGPRWPVPQRAASRGCLLGLNASSGGMAKLLAGSTEEALAGETYHGAVWHRGLQHSPPVGVCGARSSRADTLARRLPAAVGGGLLVPQLAGGQLKQEEASQGLQCATGALGIFREFGHMRGLWPRSNLLLEYVQFGVDFRAVQFVE